MKRMLCLFLALILAVGICFSAPVTITASAAETTIIEEGNCGATGSSVQWKVDDTNTLTISGAGAMADYTKLNARPWHGFRTGITAVIIEDGVTVIGKNAFNEFSALQSVIIGNGVTKIGANAFSSCKELVNLTIGNYVQKIGSSAFSSCTKLVEVSFPNYIRIDEITNNVDKNCSVFSGCTSLESVTFAAGISAIATEFFYNCSSLKSITGLKSVESIRNQAFYGCESLESVTFGSSLKSIGSNIFYGCTSLKSINVSNNSRFSSVDGVLFYDKDASRIRLIAYPAGKEGESYTIPDNVTTIGDNAFATCTKLVEVTIPITVSGIGVYAFDDCAKLESVKFPYTSQMVIEYGAFDGCAALKTVEFPDYVGSINKAIFKNCTSLESVTLPEGVGTIGDEFFYNCKSLKSVTIPDDITSIGQKAFYACESLEQITIPDGVETIAENAFDACIKLADITIPDSVKYIGSKAFYHCKALESVTILGSATEIGDNAFLGISATATVNVPCSWNENPKYTTFANSVTVDIQKHNYELGVCTACKYDCTHENKDKNGICIVCCIAEGTCGENVTWVYDSKTTTLTISGTGAMANFDSRDMLPPWANYRDSIKKVVISDGVTNIATYAFYNCTALKDITIGKNVATLDYSAFLGCSALESITVDENNSSYLSEDGILFSKDKTKIIRYPQGKAGEYSIPKDVKTIGGYAFRDCALLTSVTIPEGVTTIEEFAFFKCTSISTITIPEGVTSVGDATFVGCEKLETITLPYSLKEIGTYAFDVNAVWISEVNVPCTWNDEVFYPYFKDGVLKIPPHEMENSVCKNCGNDCIHPEYKYGTCTTEGCGKFCEHKNSDLYSCEDCGGIECGVDPILDDDDVKAYYESATKTMVFAGSGRMINKTYTNWESIKNEIEKVVIFEGVESIGASAFDSCEKLTSITIPESVTEIGELAFNNCASLTSITVADNNANFSSSEDGILFNKDKSVLICCPAGKEGDCEVPSGVTTIGNNAFSNCVKLQSVTIPVSVITIGEETFAGCEDVKLIVEPGSDAHNYAKTNSIPYIFNGYNEAETAQIEKLTFTEMRNDNSEVIEYSLSFCDKEISGALNIPVTYNGKPVTTIGNFVFEDCTALSEITIPKSVTTIGAMAFCRCSSLETITIPKSVTIIGGYAFIGCAKLTSIIVDENNINYSNSEDGVLFDKNKENLICYPAGKTETSYTVPESVTTISEGAFMDCIALTSVTIPESVTTIGVEAFYGCTALETVTIPGIETTIGNNAFYGCNNLSTVNVPCNWNTENPPYAFDENVSVVVADHKEIIYVDNNDGTHTEKYPCCGTVIGEPEKHSFNESEYCEFCEYQCPHEKYSNGVCDVCDCYCSHTNTEPVYKSYEDNTNRHYKYYECCGLEEWAGYHEDENGDTKCDQCKVQLVAKAFLEPWTSQGVRMGDNYFVSLENAVDKVNEIYGEELILLSDVTIAEGKTITLESAILNTNGKKLTVNGTLIISAEKYTGVTIPDGVIGSGTIKIGENTFKFADNGKWCCAEESQHTGSVQNCMGYLCELCGNYYGEANDNHDIVIDKAVEATCTKTGLTEGSHCTRCDGATVVQEVVPALNHKGTLVQVEAKAKTCTTVGWKAYEYCTACDYTTKVEIPASHEIVKVNAKAKTCTEAGHNAYEYCTECDYTTKVVIPASHELQEVKAKAPTCEAIGWDAYKHCTECDYTTYVEKAKLGHDIVSHSAKSATCEAIGWYAYDTCSRCDYTTYKEKAKLGHDIVTDKAVAPTCTKTGLTEGSHCTRCDGATVAQKEVSALGHTTSVINKKDATCTVDGYTGDTYCSVCKTTTVKGKAIAKLGHSYNAGEITTKATCEKDGVKTFTCTRCKDTKTETIKATGHKEVILPAVSPTYTTVGKTEGKKCSVCGTVTVARKDVAKLTLANPTVTQKNTAKGIQVNWNKIDGAESYVVYRSVYSGGKWSKWSAIKKGVTTTSYVDTTVKLGTSYKYTVRAVNGSVMSGYQNTKDGLKYNVTPTVKVALASNGIKVSWSTAANATGYTVYSSTYNTKTKKWSGWKNRGTVKASKTSWTDKSVKSGTQYKYTIRAVNGKVLSSYNKTGAATLYLAQPTVKIANASTGVKVSWNKVTGATGYTVYRSEYKNGAWTKWASRGTAKANKTSWTDTKVASGVQYKYTVRAINGKVASTYVSSNTVLYLAQPKATVKVVSNGINVAWTQSAGATGYTVYRMEYNTKTKKWSSWKKMGTAKASKKSWIDKSAKKGVTYRYTVKAVNGKAASTYKASSSVKR